MVPKRAKIDFDGPAPSEPATLPEAPATCSAPADKPAGKQSVICQRCNVECVPVPAGRGFVKCPSCGWKHKTFDGLQAKRGLRAKQDRAAR
jgi:hypothetical protein